MRLKIFLVLTLLSIFVLSGIAFGANENTLGAVYTMTNSPMGNSILVFDRSADGTLSAAGSYATGGTGTGGGLGNQGAVVLSQDDRWLFTVNAGSNDISVFAVKPEGLTLMEVISSGGLRPISLTVDRDLLYVLNAGGSVGDADNISGFLVSPDGTLSPLADSTRPLSAASTGPAQIGFTPDGRVLVVTEKATNNILTYTVGRDGYATGPNVYASSGQTPFGFGVGKRNQLFVSEAFGGAPGAGAVSSYIAHPDGTLELVSPSVATNQTAACWVIVSKGGRFAYDTNAGSGSISGFTIDFDGTIMLLDADGRTGVTGDGTVPLDMAMSTNGRYLYTLNGGDSTIGAFRVSGKGGLALIAADAASGLPASVNGLAAR
ncbi:MAG: beta-propeller fold lactonase family protein [Nitrospirota bacterium]